ncbi:MAG: MerR family transcriptional regulator [bacterium]|nr:MerR family transcriptional regulator [bacterium]
MTIGSVLSLLQAEFPAVTVSKLRFLEDQGLVSPTRTGSGYRKYSQADVERLRYTLTQQRDNFLPLRVIRENLEELDAGRTVEVSRPARMVAVDGNLVAPARGARVTARELSELTGASLKEIDDIVVSGLLTPDARGRFTARAVSVVQLAAVLSQRGIAPRNLRSMRSNAENTGNLVEQVVAPGRTQHTAVARERSAADAAELAEVASRLYAELLRISVDESS